MRKRYSITFLSFLFVFFSVSVSFADPSGLIVVRASDNTLWKATCVGTTCTGFTSFPGLFSSQPTLYWDENIQRYVLWGRAEDSTIWRSTFNRLGTFQNDWVSIPGLTPSPIAAAGGGISQNAYFENPDVGEVVTLSTTIRDIDFNYIECPWDGFVLATVSGIIRHNRTSESGTVYGQIYLSETSGEGLTVNSTYTELPSGTPIGYSSFPFSLTRGFSCPEGGGKKYVYVTGLEGGTGAATTTTTVALPGLFLQYIPYAY